ncbi:hypothetical protein BGZ83_007218 [Gryganskiella cystojenkinii]|nr:hypothetical protein BGZ83_007218 [Gryganskiella cystojenkinii]
MIQRPYECYIKLRPLEQFGAIDFFDFGAFSSDQKAEAVFQWKTMILPYVQELDQDQYRFLDSSWNESKSARHKYWQEKRKQEERDAQIDDHIDAVRSDAIKQTQDISASITRDVRKRLQDQNEDNIHNPFLDEVKADAPPLPTAIPPATSIDTYERRLSHAKDDKDQDEDVESDADGEVNDVLLSDAAMPAQPSLFDQVADLSTTSSELVSRPNLNAPSSPTIPLVPSKRAGASSTGAPLAGVSSPVTPFADGSGPDFVSDDHGNHGAAPTVDDCIPVSSPPIYSTRHLLGADLPSSDPVDADFFDQEDLDLSTSKLYAWDFLDGLGRQDSNVDHHWVYKEVEIGSDLMVYRDRIVENNGGLTEPHEMLAVNFVFLVEAAYQTGGLQGKVEDKTWESLCNVIQDPVPPLSFDIIGEAHIWAHRLSQNKQEDFMQMLDDDPPQNRSLKSILTKMADTAQLWNTQKRNEDTYLKSQLGPFLETYFAKLKYTKSDWTPTQDETRGSECSRLVPDYATTTQVGEQNLSVVLLEAKIVGNMGHCQIWDDQTKLGQEMKLALDSILLLEPEGDVCVVGLLIREPSIEFYTMRIHAEATYVMHKFASSYIVPSAMNAFSIAHLMEVFEYAKAKVEQTVTQIRQVKVRASLTPKVPLLWLRPSFRKPKLIRVADGQ